MPAARAFVPLPLRATEQRRAEQAAMAHPKIGVPPSSWQPSVSDAPRPSTALVKVSDTPAVARVWDTKFSLTLLALLVVVNVAFSYLFSITPGSFSSTSTHRGAMTTTTANSAVESYLRNDSAPVTTAEQIPQRGYAVKPVPLFPVIERQ